ncbi:MAG: hypothetical protein ACI9V1_003641 [Spirosomataceae bacterium]|jgi:hypothetical protein
MPLIVAVFLIDGSHYSNLPDELFLSFSLWEVRNFDLPKYRLSKPGYAGSSLWWLIACRRAYSSESAEAICSQ